MAWYEKIKIPDHLRKNRKLTDEQRQDIIKLYNEGYSIRALARMFKVDRNAIKWHVYGKEYQKHHYETKKKRNYDYERERHTKYVRRWRKRKKELFELKNKIFKGGCK